MDTIGIGKLIRSKQERDAIHLAILPVIATTKLQPGQSIRVECINIGRYAAYPADDSMQGIVDPFLKGYVLPKQEFWMFLTPGSIISLKHNWTHPEIDGGSNEA